MLSTSTEYFPLYSHITKKNTKLFLSFKSNEGFKGCFEELWLNTSSYKAKNTLFIPHIKTQNITSLKKKKIKILLIIYPSNNSIGLITVNLTLVVTLHNICRGRGSTQTLDTPLIHLKKVNPLSY